MIRDDFLNWKVQQKPFTDDEMYFREKFGTAISPYCKVLFRELVEMQEQMVDMQNHINHLRQEIE